MTKLLLGVFPQQEEADETIMDLADAGFVTDEISVIAKEDTMQRYRSREVSGETIVTGGILGGLAGLFIATTPIILPGFGILVAGPLAAITGLALGAVAGGVLGALIDMGVSESQARRYERRIQEGAILIGVTVDETNEKTALKVMEQHNAEELTLIPLAEKVRTFRQSSSSVFQGAKGGKTSKRNKRNK